MQQPVKVEVIACTSRSSVKINAALSAATFKLMLSSKEPRGSSSLSRLVAVRKIACMAGDAERRTSQRSRLQAQSRSDPACNDVFSGQDYDETVSVM